MHLHFRQGTTLPYALSLCNIVLHGLFNHNPSAILCPQVAFNKLDPTEYCLILSPVTSHFFENCPCRKPLGPYLKLCVS